MNNDDEGLECYIFVGQATYIYSFIVCLLLINLKASLIDLFTNMAAVINLLDLRSIMGYPGGALAHYLCVLYGQKENFAVYFSGKGRSLLHPNTAQQSFSTKT